MTDWRTRRDQFAAEQHSMSQELATRLAASIDAQRIAEGRRLAQQAIEGMAQLSQLVDVLCERDTDAEFACREIAERYKRSAEYIVVKFMGL